MENQNFDFSNHQHLIYKHPPLEIAVLGGIRLEGLDRMRVTLKVGMEHLSIRHSFDLYNDSQTERMIRKIAERLEVGTSVSASALSSLTDLLEAWRLEERHQRGKTKTAYSGRNKEIQCVFICTQSDESNQRGFREVRNHWRRR